VTSTFNFVIYVFLTQLSIYVLSAWNSLKKMPSTMTTFFESLLSEKKNSVELTQADHLTVFLSVRNLPKMDGVFGKCDPYYKLFLDGVHISGSAKDFISDKLEGSWSFKHATRAFNNAKTLKIEFWDKDTGKKIRV